MALTAIMDTMETDFVANERVEKPSNSNSKSTKHFETDLAKIYHEDSLRFLKSLPNESVDLIITDPAYSGMNQHLKLGTGRIIGTYNDKSVNGKWFEEFHDTAENYEQFLKECLRVLKKDRHLFIMFDSYSLISLGSMVRDVFNVKNIITWDKVNIGMGHYFRRQTEFIIFACKGKRAIVKRNIPDIWKIKRIHGAKYPTQKPVELFEAMIASSRTKDDKEFIVCDPFTGSGSSAIAALKQNATFIGCDISPKAISMSQSRIEEYLNTGIDNIQPKSAHDPLVQKKFW